MVGTPVAKVGIEPEGHHAGGVGESVDREFLDGDLGLGGLQFSSERHQDSGASDRRVEHLDESFLACDIGILQVGEHSLFEVLPGDFTVEGVIVLNSSDHSLGVVFGSRAVDKVPPEVNHQLSLVEHPHPLCGCHVGDMRHLYVLRVAILFEFFLVFGFNHYGHPLLGLADSKLSGIHAAVFDGHPVEVDVQSGCQLSDSDTDSSRSEIVGFLYEGSDFRAAEQPLEFPLFRRVTLLDLTSAGLKGLFGVLF